MRLITLISVFAALVLAVGCGSSGGGTSDTGAAESGASTTAAGGDETSAGEDNSASSDNSGGDETNGGDETSGGETSGGDDGTALTKAELIKQGDAICTQVPEEFTKNQEALSKKSKAKLTQEETNLKAAVPPLYVAAERMEALVPPSGDEAEVEAIIAALESAAKGLEAKPKSELSGPKSPFAEFQKLTKAYGFQTCSAL
jgi:hypothetical protein